MGVEYTLKAQSTSGEIRTKQSFREEQLSKQIEVCEEEVKKARLRLLRVSQKQNPRAYDAAVEVVEQAEKALYNAYFGPFKENV